MDLHAWHDRLRARLYEWRRRPNKAIREYRAVRALDPSSANATRALAYLLAARMANFPALS